MISCICITCARVKHLESAIASFLAQYYQGPRELVVLNTCVPYQNLQWEGSDLVRVYNAPDRPKSIGDARNMAIAMAAGTRIVTWDDDDHFLPHHLSSIAKAFDTQKPDRTPPMDPKKSGCDWIWLDTQFWGWGDTIKDIVPGQCPCFAFTKRAWEEVGGYPNLSVGEDRDFISKVTQRFPGSKYPCADNPSFVYRWSNGVYHMSGQGDDTPDRQPAHDRYWADVQHRVNTGKEPHGTISLKPRCDVDWVGLAEEYLGQRLKKNPMNDVCMVELGRLGDIINILPIANHIFKTRVKPHIMISQEFLPIFDGISYATPYPVPFPFHDLAQGLRLAKAKFGNVIQCQIYGGAPFKPEMLTSNFSKESWRLAGYLNEYHNPDWKLTFDGRDKSREQIIARKMFRNRLPKVITNLTQAVSAPLPIGQAILADLTRRLHMRCEVIDIGRIRFPYFYDMLGLLDAASLFITIDTATLHMAAASDVPMIALVRDGWVGAEPRVNCLKKFTYSEVNKEPESVILAAMQHLFKE